MSTTTAHTYANTRAMPARFASWCGACGERITKGSPILYRPGHKANHAQCDEPTTRLDSSTGSRPSRNRSRTMVTSSGRFYGRCEDAPCCGCCQ